MKKSINIIGLICPFIVVCLTSHAQIWEPQANGKLSADAVYAISAVDSITVWACASNEWYLAIGGVPFPEEGVTVLRSINGGEDWEPSFVSDTETFPSGGGVGIMSFDICALNKDTAFLTTNDYNHDGVLFMTTNGGQDWQRKYDDLSAGVWVRFFNRTEGVVIGVISSNLGSSAPGPAVSRTTDGGLTWESVIMPPSTSYIGDNYESNQNACQVLGNTIWFFTADGHLFKSTDKGSQWMTIETPLKTKDPLLINTRSLAFTDTLHGLAYMKSYNWSNGVTFDYIYKTADGGQTWEEVIPDEPVPPFYTIVPVPGSDRVIVGHGKYNSISGYTTDFGLTWTINETDRPLGTVSFHSPTVGWASHYNNNVPFTPPTPVMYKWKGDFTTVSTSSLTPAPELRIYPSPFSDHICLASHDKMDQYRLSSIDGVTVHSGKISSTEISVDLGELPHHIYILEVFYGDGRKVVQKIIGGY